MNDIQAGEAFFVAVGDELHPNPCARGPWSDDMLHGRLLAGLMARAVELDAADSELELTRLTVDLFRVAPMKPLRVTTRRVRDGRRIRAVDVDLLAGDVAVARASALLLARGEQPLGKVWLTEDWSVPAPEELEQVHMTDPELWDLRYISGTREGNGRRAWVRDDRPLVAGTETSPLVRLASVADFASPLSSFNHEDKIEFINADITLHVMRPPIGEWVGFEVSGRLSENGAAVGQAILYDRQGPIGFSTTGAMAQLRKADSAW